MWSHRQLWRRRTLHLPQRSICSKPCVFVETVGNRLATVLKTVRFLWKPLETVGNRLATVLETVCDFVETVAPCQMK